MEVQNSPLEFSFSWRRLFTVHERPTTSFPPALRRRNTRYKNPQLFVHAILFVATNVFVAGQVDRARWKTGNIDENLQGNNVARQVEGFCMSYFAAFTCNGQLRIRTMKASKLVFLVVLVLGSMNTVHWQTSWHLLNAIEPSWHCKETDHIFVIFLFFGKPFRWTAIIDFLEIFRWIKTVR